MPRAIKKRTILIFITEILYFSFFLRISCISSLSGIPLWNFTTF